MPTSDDKIRSSDSWRATSYDPAVAKSGERRESFTTSSVEVDPLYAPDGEIDDDYLSSIGFPGQYPFTRGVQPTMYRGRLWTMRQYAGFGTALETNRKFRALLEMGQTGLSVAFDLPTQLGYDSDDPLARDEVGQVGVAIDSLADFETVFEEIPLDQISTSMTINAPASVLLAMYVAIGEAQGVARTELRGTVQNDVLKEYVARGTYIFPPGPSLRLATDVMEFCAREVPRFNAISVSGYHIRDAGSTAAQEMGLTLSNAIAYVDSALARGLEVDDFAGNISWIFNTHNDFFEEVAKFRALRRMWARIMRERFGATNPRSWMLRTHTQTGGSTLTAQQPENNIARTAVQALAAVLGGVQSMALSCYDEALALPTDAAQRTALRTQQIIAHETGAADTIDPLAGSYFVEALTDRLEAEALAIMRRVEDLGGAVSAIEAGYMQTEIAEAAARHQREVDSGERIVVGVNAFQEGNEEGATPVFRVDPALAEGQRSRLAEFRSRRDDQQAQDALAKLGDAAAGEQNLMEPLIDAVKRYATVGEICGVLRKQFGEYTPLTVI
ncbi:MAG: methylmalonyl-CoA mutase family protein [Chloroflexi bacterium]|nr:methylmalonyl-CoA mutase family protein [Chloroflexota bacterium]